MAITTTEGTLLIVEQSPPFEALVIQFYPKELVESRDISLADTGVLGYNNSGTNYTGGDDYLSFTLVFYGDDLNRDNALKSARWLKSLGMTNGRKGQPRVSIQFGTLYTGKIYQLKSYSAKLSEFNSLADNIPVFTTVDLKFKQIVNYLTTVEDVRL